MIVDMDAEPVLVDIDAVTLHVEDLDAGLGFYRDVLGHDVLWRNDQVGQAGVESGRRVCWSRSS